MHHPTDRIAHTTVFVTPVVEHWLEREIAQWVHSMKDRSTTNTTTTTAAAVAIATTTTTTTTTTTIDIPLILYA